MSSGDNTKVKKRRTKLVIVILIIITIVAVTGTSLLVFQTRRLRHELDELLTNIDLLKEELSITQTYVVYYSLIQYADDLAAESEFHEAIIIYNYEQVIGLFASFVASNTTNRCTAIRNLYHFCSQYNQSLYCASSDAA